MDAHKIIRKFLDLKKIFFFLLLLAIALSHRYSEFVFINGIVAVDEAGNELLQKKLDLNGKFREGGYFTQAVQDGYNKFTNTPKYAPRFSGNDKSCIDCHTSKDMGYAFVQMDRYDYRHQKRVSFEEQIMRCYVKRLNGHVPPFYDPSLQNIKIFARFMSIGYGLQEGSLKEVESEKTL